ncbi:amino-acid N-acetyltransferase [Jatrophihabitans sp.]|jgi:amino-acid N-acetyltransferase|uniref:amino-acid N-acetyltransferase n=1 Tax=Jatrophihabitans sp. TaxID=1932789 RepID=UPI002EE4CCFE
MPEISPANAADHILIRRARTSDVPAIKDLVDTYTGQRVLLAKDTVTLYESVQEFRVAEQDGAVIGCGAVHVLWEDLGEIRTLAVAPERRGRRIGDLLLGELIAGARELGLHRLFALTFQTRFFARHGFIEIDDTPVDTEVYAQLRRSYDAGIAEFLDLEYVKPNTLGNCRMLLTLDSRPHAPERAANGRWPLGAEPSRGG